MPQGARKEAASAFFSQQHGAAGDANACMTMPEGMRTSTDNKRYIIRLITQNDNIPPTRFKPTTPCIRRALEYFPVWGTGVFPARYPRANNEFLKQPLTNFVFGLH
jgi:hypothetical protein